MLLNTTNTGLFDIKGAPIEKAVFILHRCRNWSGTLRKMIAGEEIITGEELSYIILLNSETS